MTRIKKSKPRQVAFLFAEGAPACPEVFGGKGAGLIDLASLSVPVPPGFNISTAVARAFAQHGRVPNRLAGQVDRGLSALEQETGKVYGAASNPLLLSVRSGAAVSMPGMMDTVLNLGMNPDIASGLARLAGKRFAWDCYRRMLAMFGEVVLGIPQDFFEESLGEVRASCGAACDQELTGDSLEALSYRYRQLIEELTCSPVPDCPRQQLNMAVLAVLRSWGNPRARAYRQAHGIPEHLGTAVTIQSMVFGNRDDRSGSGVAFSSNVATGEPGLWGEFLVNAQGEEVVSGSRTPMPISDMAVWSQPVYSKLDETVSMLASHRACAVDVEFTVESGKLFILQVRAARLTPVAAATIATRLVWAKKLKKDQALDRLTAEQLQSLECPDFKPDALQAAVDSRLVARGLPASPGSAVGVVVRSSRAAVDAAQAGCRVILVRPDTSPEDLPGMLAAAAIVTETGGATSHAAVVARGLGKPAVVGCSSLQVQEGQTISVDGTSGVVVSGAVEMADDSSTKEVRIFLSWARQLLAVKPRLVFEMFDQSVSFNRLINDFYLAERMAEAAAGSPLARRSTDLRSRVHTEIAERMAMYLVVACGGEVRHTSEYWSAVSEEIKVLRRDFGVLFDRNDRPEAQVSAVNKLKTLSFDDQIRFLELVSSVFEKGGWSGTYGGPRWAAIARAALGFLKEELSHTVFADHAFDLEHNGGCVFGKNPMLTGDRYLVKRQLDSKKHAAGVVDLYQKLSSLSRDWSAEVEELYATGKRLAIW